MLYNTLLVPAIYHHGSATGVHMSPPSGTSLEPPTPCYPSRYQRAPDLSSLCHTPSSHRISSFIDGDVYVSMLGSQFISSPSQLCPHVCSLCLCLHCCPAHRFISTIFLDSTYMHSVQSLSHVQLFETPWATARQASPSITNSRSLLKLM